MKIPNVVRVYDSPEKLTAFIIGLIHEKLLMTALDINTIFWCFLPAEVIYFSINHKI